MSNIYIKKYNGSSYELQKPYGYYSDNSDMVDGKHASDFINNSSLLNINNLKGYVNELRTLKYVQSTKTYTYTDDNQYNGFPFSYSSNSYCGLNTLSSIPLEATVGANSLDNKTLINLSMKFMMSELRKGYDTENTTFTVTNSTPVNLVNGVNFYPPYPTQGEYWTGINIYYKFVTPRTYVYVNPYGNSGYLQKSDKTQFTVIQYTVSTLDNMGIDYAFANSSASTNVWINSTQFYYKSVYLPSSIVK